MCPQDRDAQPVQKFSAFTCDLHRLADWLTTCRITTVVMESTGVYWIPLFQILEARGFEVALVNARHVKNVPGRPKTDRFDCRWLQKLHTYGLLAPSFRPPEDICQLRSLLRHRDNLIQMTVKHIQHMHKALDQMNLHLHHVISDVTGVTGLRILRAIVAGERDPRTLAQYRDYRIKSSPDTIAKALEGIIGLNMSSRSPNPSRSMILPSSKLRPAIRKSNASSAPLRPWLILMPTPYPHRRPPIDNRKDTSPRLISVLICTGSPAWISPKCLASKP